MKNLFRKTISTFKNNKFGFSLVELIVVIAIMAVIAVVLVPSLLSYVEESRANKDMKTTDELVSSVELGLTDQDVYDEILAHAVFDNISCYIDQPSESTCENKIIVKEAMENQIEQYEFGDNERQNDEVIYYGAGNMRGATITFSPIKDSNNSEYVIQNAIINKFVGRKTGYLYENEKLYNAIRTVVGDKIYNSSQTYRNSDFTVFIRIGTTGANDTSSQDAIKVYGQYNGTNLAYDNIKTCKIASNRVVGTDGSVDEIVSKLNNHESINPDMLDFGENGMMGMANYKPLNGDDLDQIILQPGLYDKNDKLIASWDTLVNDYGLDVSINYKKEDVYDAKTACKSHINYIMTNNELKDGKKLIISSSVTNLGEWAFGYNKKLNQIVLPISINRIGRSVFQFAQSLKDINIPYSVIEIDNSAFGYNALQTIVVNKNNTVYDSRNNCNAIIKTETNELLVGCPNTIIPYGVKRICGDAFYGQAIKNIEIPNTVESIGPAALYGTSIKELVLPDSVTKIETNAFASSALESVVLSKNISTISVCAFDNCVNLKTIYMPDSIKSINTRAFYNCHNLKTIYIPKKCTSITTYSDGSMLSPFYKCSPDLKFYCEGDAPGSNWTTYWNYVQKNTPCEVNWGVTRLEYETLNAN